MQSWATTSMRKEGLKKGRDPLQHFLPAKQIKRTEQDETRQINANKSTLRLTPISLGLVSGERHGRTRGF